MAGLCPVLLRYTTCCRCRVGYRLPPHRATRNLYVSSTNINIHLLFYCNGLPLSHAVPVWQGHLSDTRRCLHISRSSLLGGSSLNEQVEEKRKARRLKDIRLSIANHANNSRMLTLLILALLGGFIWYEDWGRSAVHAAGVYVVRKWLREERTGPREWALVRVAALFAMQHLSAAALASVIREHNGVTRLLEEAEEMLEINSRRHRAMYKRKSGAPSDYPGREEEGKAKSRVGMQRAPEGEEELDRENELIIQAIVDSPYSSERRLRWTLRALQNASSNVLLRERFLHEDNVRKLARWSRWTIPTGSKEGGPLGLDDQLLLRGSIETVLGNLYPLEDKTKVWQVFAEAGRHEGERVGSSIFQTISNCICSQCVQLSATSANVWGSTQPTKAKPVGERKGGGGGGGGGGREREDGISSSSRGEVAAPSPIDFDLMGMEERQAVIGVGLLRCLHVLRSFTRRCLCDSAMEQGEILFSRLSVMKGGHVYPTTLHNMISKLEEVRDIEPSLEVKKDFKTKREGGMVYDGNDTLVLDRAGEGDSLAETTPWTGGDAPPVHHTGSPSLRVRTLHLIEDVLGVVETSFPSSGSDVKYELLCTIASVLLLLCDDVHVRRLVVGRSDGGDVEPSPCVVQWLETLRVWAELRADEGDDMQEIVAKIYLLLLSDPESAAVALAEGFGTLCHLASLHSVKVHKVVERINTLMGGAGMGGQGAEEQTESSTQQRERIRFSVDRFGQVKVTRLVGDGGEK